jgi:molybdopterin molybdotransferase
MKAARNQMEQRIPTLATERVEVSRAGGRIMAEDLKAEVDLPAWDESLRDGFVLPSSPPGPSRGSTTLQIVGELAAGANQLGLETLQPGCACRIFTGAMIPRGGQRVVPSELCEEMGDRLLLREDSRESDSRFGSYIKKKGSEVRAGENLLKKGTRIRGDQLLLLAALSIAEIRVGRRPRVACYCTGNELVGAGKPLAMGQKHSTNSLILGERLPRFGALVQSLKILADDRSALIKVFSQLAEETTDMLITTGGTGPGKYDLVSSAFRDAGGESILNRLPMRPGKSILLGLLAGKVVIGLPGPPQAVRTLVNELVGPVLLKMQGADNIWPEPLLAEAQEQFSGNNGDLLRLKGGVIFCRQGRCLVRKARRFEPVGCFILLPPGQGVVRCGEMVKVHLSR